MIPTEKKTALSNKIHNILCKIKNYYTESRKMGSKIKRKLSQYTWVQK